MMMITPELRALMAEKVAAAERELIMAAAERKTGVRTARVMARIDAAASRLDAGPLDPRKWPPSKRIKIGYLVIATARTTGCEQRAMEFVTDQLSQQEIVPSRSFAAITGKVEG